MNEHFPPPGRNGRLDLARQPDMDLAGLIVRPALCEVEANGRIERLEPRVMQVLVALAEARGAVVSRDDLIESCWGGRVVGEDAINRCIGRLRRLFETAEVAVEIRTIPRVGYRLHVQGAQPQGARHSHLPRPALLAAVVVVAAGAALAAWVLRPSAAWTVTDFRPFAAETLIERHPAFSPDGRTMAYAAGPDVDSRRIVVRGLDGGAATTISTGPGDDYAPAFAPDGNRLAYARAVMGKPCEIIVQPLPSGPAGMAGRCTGEPRTRLAWSHDGRSLYFTDSSVSSGGTHLRLLDLASGRARDLTAPGAAGDDDIEPAVSPDGRRLAFVREHATGQADIRMLDLSTGKVRLVPSPGVTPGAAAWTPDGKALVLPSDRSGDFTLWLVRADGAGKPRRLLTGLRAIGRVAVSRDGRLALEMDSARINLTRLNAAQDQIAPANSSDWSPDYAGDGSLAFISNRGGGKSVWVERPGQGAAQLSGSEFDHLYGVRWSPDGRRIAFGASKAGVAGLYVANADGLGVARLPAKALDFGAPAWTADGAALIVPSRDAGGWRLMRVSLQPGEASRPVSGYGWISVRTSPAGLLGVRADQPGVRRVDAPTGAPPLAPSITAALPEDWAVWNGRLYVLNRTKRDEGDVTAYPLTGGAGRLVGHARKVSEEPGFAVDPTSGTVVFPSVLVEDSDIGLMRLQRGG